MYFSRVKLPVIGKLDRRAWLTLILDSLLVLGVMYLGWSPVRVIGMYYLEVIGVMTGFIFFMSRNEIWQIKAVHFAGLIAMILVVTPWIAASVSSTGMFDVQQKRLIQIYEPYFDVGLYVIGVFIVQHENYKQFSTIGETTFVAYATYAASSLLFVPSLLVGAVILESATGSMPVAIVISIVVSRTLLEWMRKRRIRKAIQEAATQ